MEMPRVEWIKSKKEIILFCALALIGLIAHCSQGSGRSPEPATVAAESFDTFIPDGFSLVPIEVSNYETLDSLLGPYGVVDLFTTPLTPKERAQRIAYRIKILRAPKNPSHFAVLVPFDEVKNILRYSGPYMVSVQNPKARGTGFEKEAPKRRSRPIYHAGE